MFLVSSAFCFHDSTKPSACHDHHPDGKQSSDPFWVDSVHFLHGFAFFSDCNMFMDEGGKPGPLRIGTLNPHQLVKKKRCHRWMGARHLGRFRHFPRNLCWDARDVLNIHVGAIRRYCCLPETAVEQAISVREVTLT